MKIVKDEYTGIEVQRYWHSREYLFILDTFAYLSTYDSYFFTTEPSITAMGVQEVRDNCTARIEQITINNA